MDSTRSLACGKSDWRVERVAVAVERGERQPAGGELAEVLLAGVLARAQGLDRQVDRRQEAAGVDLGAGQPEVGDHLEGLAEGLVVQACVVGAEVHGWVLSSRGVGLSCWGREGQEGYGVTSTAAPPAAAERATASMMVRSRRPSSKVATGGRPCDAGDLLEERAGLVAEEVADAEGAAGEVHRQAALDVGVGGAGEDLVVAVESVAAQLADDGELCRPVHVPLRAAVLGHEVERQRVGVAGGDPRDREGADGAGGEVRREGRHVVVLDRLAHVAELGLGVAVGRAERHDALGDLGREGGAADAGHRSADELGEVDEVAADVGEGAGAGAALVAPGHGRLRAQGVVAPVAPVEVRHLAELGLEQVADRGDGGLAAVDEAGAGDEVRVGLRGGDHRLGVLDARGQGLLAQHVLAGGEQRLDDRAVQLVGHDDADDLDVVGLEQLAPVGAVALVAVAGGRVLGHALVGVDDGDVADRGEWRVEQGGGGAVAGAVGAAGHAGADDGDPDGGTGHDVPL